MRRHPARCPLRSTTSAETLRLVPRRRPKLTRSWGPIPTRSLRSRRWRSFVTFGVPYDEALRLWPTARAFTRSPNVDTVMGDRYRMRPQDWAIILIPFIHRDPSAWGEDAEEFRPDRFLPESSRRRAPRSYKPFGTGERACIGRKLALHEAVLVLARLLHRYDITGDPDYELAVSERLTLMPQGFRMTLARRTPATSPPTGGPPR
jgi:hypothetical protein